MLSSAKWQIRAKIPKSKVKVQPISIPNNRLHKYKLFPPVGFNKYKYAYTIYITNY